MASAILGSIIGRSINDFFAGSIAKLVKFNIALAPPFPYLEYTRAIINERR